MAENIEETINGRNLAGHFVLCITDCEPSIDKAGRIMEEKKVKKTYWLLQRPTGVHYSASVHRAGDGETTTLQRALVTRFTK